MIFYKFYNYTVDQKIFHQYELLYAFEEYARQYGDEKSQYGQNSKFLKLYLILFCTILLPRKN